LKIDRYNVPRRGSQRTDSSPRSPSRCIGWASKRESAAERCAKWSIFNHILSCLQGGARACWNCSRGEIAIQWLYYHWLAAWFGHSNIARRCAELLTFAQIKDSFRYRAIKSNKSFKGRVLAIWDSCQGWVAASLIGVFTAVVAFLVRQL